MDLPVTVAVLGFPQTTKPGSAANSSTCIWLSIPYYISHPLTEAVVNPSNTPLEV